jgi:hypothetical protein
MKKLLLSISTIIISVTVLMAQAPDFGFETWVNVPLSSSVQDPQGWASFNVAASFGMSQTVFKETAAPHVGTASAKVVTDVLPPNIQVPNPLTPGQNFDTVGLLTIGKTQFSPPYIKFGYSYAWRPATLSFGCKYTPGTGDTAFVVVFLTKWNGNSRDTIARGTYKTGTSSNTYTVQNLNLTYNTSFNNVMPDTQQVYVSSSIYAHDGAKQGSTFYIDGLSWSGYVGISDINGTANAVSIFPNPAENQINFNCSIEADAVELTDITGRKVGIYKMNNNTVTVQTSEFTPGIYLYNMLNNKKETINRGKFEVTK